MSRPFSMTKTNLFLGDNGGTEMLFNVMKAYAVCDPEVGYCQGSAFLAGMLLLHMPEEDAFSVFMKLMSKGSGKNDFTSITLPLVIQSDNQNTVRMSNLEHVLILPLKFRIFILKVNFLGQGQS